MRRAYLLLASVLVVVLGATRSATLLATNNSGEPPPPDQCIMDTSLSLSGTPDTVDWRQPAKLEWTASVPANCEGVVLTLDDQAVGSTGTKNVVPTRRTTYRLVASRQRGYVFSYKEATAEISVRYPPVVPIDTRTTDPVDVLLGALEPGPSQSVVVTLGCNVDLNLSGHAFINITDNRNLVAASACQRSMSRLGPRIYVTDARKAYPLFKVTGDNVKISGFRLQGPTDYMAQGDRKEKGIVIGPPAGGPLIRNVEVSNMDIYNWSGLAVQVADSWITEQPRGRLDKINGMAVRIQDNYLHHNRHGAGEGYGAEVSSGAYALIDRNVFNENRHAIAGGSKGADKKDEDGNVIEPSVDYSGYTVRDNLIQEGGGLHCRDGNEGVWGAIGGAITGAVIGGIVGGLPGAILGGLIGATTGGAGGAVAQGYCWQTHMIDMHGDSNEWYSSHNWQCGTAGETMMIERNTVLYTKGASIKIRGNPRDRATVQKNVFKNGSQSDAIKQNGGCGYGDNITNPIVKIDNVFGRDPTTQLASCNFGSGGQDKFMATGVTWWAKSAVTGQWYYLNTMPEMLPQLHIGDMDGDGICDVAREINPRNQYYSKSGRTPWIALGSVPVGPPVG